MSPQIIGLLAGGAFGLVNFGILRWLADRAEGRQSTDASRRQANILRSVAWGDLIVFPVVGYFVAPMVLN